MIGVVIAVGAARSATRMGGAESQRFSPLAAAQANRPDHKGRTGVLGRPWPANALARWIKKGLVRPGGTYARGKRP